MLQPTQAPALKVWVMKSYMAASDEGNHAQVPNGRRREDRLMTWSWFPARGARPTESDILHLIGAE